MSKKQNFLKTKYYKWQDSNKDQDQQSRYSNKRYNKK